MHLREILDRLQKHFRSENSTRMIILLGAAGIALILFSGMLPTHTSRNPPVTAAADMSDPDTYRNMLEDQLTELLSQMEGVGQVTVMLTVSGSAEQVYAEEVKADKSDSSVRTESRYVITRTNGSESALLSETRNPAIQGAAILCSGGGHAAVQERVSSAVSAVLGIPASRIFVGKTAASSISERSFIS